MKRMKRTSILSALIALAAVSLAPAQTSTVSEPAGKTLAATMSVFVFPAQGQTPEQQSKDEVECYNWAVGNVGSDPFELSKTSEQAQQQAEKEKQQAKQATQGAGASGAVKGAAAGALIGEIASDDPGKGAAYGAAAGLIASRRRAKRSQQQASAQADQKAAQTQKATAAQIEGFKKAFSVCLEAKSYMVKY